MSNRIAKQHALNRQVMSIWDDVITASEEAYAGEQMIAMLPEGLLRENAKREQNEVRLDLHNRIFAYEEARLNLRNYCIDNGLPQSEWKDGLAVVREHLRQAIFNK